MIGYAVVLIEAGEICFTGDQTDRNVYQIYVDRDAAEEWCKFLNGKGQDHVDYKVSIVNLWLALAPTN